MTTPEPESAERGTAPIVNPAFVYLDSNFYLDYLRGDRGYHDTLEALMSAWYAGQVRVATSTVTLTEVLYARRWDEETRVLLSREFEERIIDLFHPSAPRDFLLVELDRSTAEAARRLVWDFRLSAKDAIHVASAIRARTPVMMTSDDRLQRKSELVGATPPLRIEKPYWIVQHALDL